MAKQKQDDQPELTYSSYVRTQDVTQKTCRRRWMIGRSGVRDIRAGGTTWWWWWFQSCDVISVINLFKKIFTTFKINLKKKLFLSCRKNQDLRNYGKTLKKTLYNNSINIRRCPWCNGYHRRIWTRRHEFKSWTWLIAFHIALIPLGKVWIQIFSP